MQVDCAFTKEPDGRLKLVATNFNISIESFFQLRISGFNSPRSTYPSASFEFKSLDGDGKVLDTQKRGLVAFASKFKYLNDVVLVSSSPVVAERNSTFNLQFVGSTQFIETDTIKVQLPKWNSNSNFIQRPIMSYGSSPACSGILNTRENINCYLIPGGARDPFDTLVLSNPFAGTVQVGQVVSFSMSPLINPISTYPQTGYKVFTFDRNGGSLSQGFTTLSISKETIIDPQNVAIETTETEITKLTSFEIRAALPVPLDAGCRVQILIPPTLQLTSLVDVVVGGMFGSERSASFSIQSKLNVIEINDACLSYRENQGQIIIKLRQFINPGYVVQSRDFKLTFTDLYANLICSTGGGLRYSTTPGVISVGEWSVTSSIVSELTTMTFAFQPTHATSSADVQIKITMPQEDFLTLPSPCVIESANQFINIASVDCSTDQTTFTIVRALKEPYLNDGKSYIQLRISDIRMPSSERPTGSYRIDFFDKIEGEYRLVDTVQVSNMVRATAGETESVKVVSRFNQTWTDDTFEFSIQTAHVILQGGSIEVVLPSELQLLETAACSNFELPLSQNSWCIFSPDHNLIQLLGAFNDAPQNDVSTKLKFSISGIFTQRQQKQTSNFHLRTIDKDGYDIDRHNTSFLPPISAKRTINYATATSSSTEVGSLATYTLQLKSPVPLLNGDVIILQGPTEGISRELSYNYESCAGVELLNSQLMCQLKGINGIEITIKLKDGLIEIPAETPFSFSLNKIQNPQSTKPSGPFSVKIQDEQGYLVASQTTDLSLMESFILQAAQPSSLLYASVVSESRVPQSMTLLKFMVITKHELPPNSNITMQLPSLLKISEPDFSTWTSTNPDANRKFSLTKREDGSSLLRMMSVNRFKLIGGSTITFEIRGMVNDATSRESDSFTILTETREGFLIDYYDKGLVVSAACNYPCMTCPEGQPNVCHSCDQAEGAPLPIYFESKCINECPKRFFFQDNLCPACDSDCLECFGQSQKCTKCQKGKFLLGNTCLDVCPDDYYESDELGTCVLCEKPCKTCEGTGTFCTSCDTTTPFYLIFENKCFAECPAEVSVFSEGRCVHCSDNCKTCTEKFDSCTSCYADQRLNKLDLRCVDTCPSEITVSMLTLPSAGQPVKQPMTCELCNSNCLTCHPFNTEVCTECRDGLVMIENTKECVKQCPAKTAAIWIPLTQDTVCAECANGCSECLYSRDHCTICEPGFVFYQYQCLAQCPVGFKVESGECVPSQTVCKFGYELNEAGECVLELAKCKRGYVLNAQMDKCIPKPGFHLPFAFLYATAFWAFIVLRASNRNKFTKEVIISQLLIGFTFCQQVACLSLFGLSIAMGFKLVLAIHLVCIAFQFVLNLSSLVAYLMLIKDPVFTHWRKEDENDEDSYIIFALNTLFSYKAIRLFYCQLFSKKYFNAACQDLYQTFIRPMWVLNLIGLVHLVTFLFVNIYTIWLLPWGYEIKTLAIESSVIAVGIFFLEILEFNAYRKHQPKYMNVHQYFAPVLLKKKIGEVAVMAADDENQDSSTNEVALLESIIKRLKEGEKLSRLEHTMIEAQKAYQEEISNEEEIRKEKLKTSAKHRQEKFREKRKHFEHFREVRRQAERDQVSLDLNEIEWRKQEARERLEEARLAQLPRPVLAEIDFELLRKVDQGFQNSTEGRKVKNTGENSVSNVSTYNKKEKSSTQKTHDSAVKRQKSSGRSDDKSGRNKLRSIESIEKSSKHLTKRKTILIKPEPELTNLEKLQKLTDWELNDDRAQYDRAYQHYKDEFDVKAKQGALVPNLKLNQSFDEDVLREMYEDFGPESDYESELSWISYPPKHGFLRDFWENNPKKLAECVVFQEKIKYKYQFNNCVTAVYPVPEPKPKVIRPSRRTQTFGYERAQDDGSFDPFASANENDESSDEEAFSALDDDLCPGILDDVIRHGFSSDSEQKVKLTKEEVHAKAMAEKKIQSKKIKRTGKATPMQLETEGSQQLTAQGEGEVELGTVFDKDGKILYDKDYMSQIEDDQVSLNEDDMESVLEPEPVEQPGQFEQVSDSESDDSVSRSIKKKKPTRESQLSKAYKPSLHLLAEFGVKQSSITASQRSRVSRKSRKSGKSMNRVSPPISMYRHARADSATSIPDQILNLASKRKSENEDQRQTDETRGNISSAMEMTDQQNRINPNPGYSTAGQWERGDMSQGEFSAEDSNPFKFAKNGQSNMDPRSGFGARKEYSQRNDQKQNLALGIVNDLEEELDNANLSDVVPQFRMLESSAEQATDFYGQIRAQDESIIEIRRPQPFAALGLDSKPYKANTRKRQKQMAQDQRRAIVTDAFSRMNKLENIYLKNSVAGQRLGMTNPNFNIKPMTPINVPVTDEYLKAHQRHNTTMNKQQKKGMRGTLRKQNFIEDGQNIIGSLRNFGKKKSPRQHGRDQRLAIDSDEGQLHADPSADQSYADSYLLRPHTEQRKTNAYGRGIGKSCSNENSILKDDRNQGLRNALSKLQYNNNSDDGKL